MPWLSQMCKSRCPSMDEMAILGFHPIFHIMCEVLKCQTPLHMPSRTLKIANYYFGEFPGSEICPIQYQICPLKSTFAISMRWQCVSAVPDGNQTSRVAKVPCSMLKQLIFSSFIPHIDEKMSCLSMLHGTLATLLV